MKAQKKPIIVDYFKLPEKGDYDLDAFDKWSKEVDFNNFTSEKNECLGIEILEGVMIASPGDIIIKGINGEFYPCKPDIFLKTYDIIS